eukprot:COSAG02_NODE_816_length_16859_cov_15.645764_11_plen_106_part_00
MALTVGGAIASTGAGAGAGAGAGCSCVVVLVVVVLVVGAPCSLCPESSTAVVYVGGFSDPLTELLLGWLSWPLYKASWSGQSLGDAPTAPAGMAGPPGHRRTYST